MKVTYFMLCKNFDNNININILTATNKFITDTKVRCTATRIFAVRSYIFYLFVYK